MSLRFEVLGELFYRRLVVIERTLQPGGRDARLPENIEAGLLTLDDLDEYMAARPQANRGEVRRRLEEGLCWFSRNWRRAALGKVVVPPFGRGFSRHPGLSIRCYHGPF